MASTAERSTSEQRTTERSSAAKDLGVLLLCHRHLLHLLRSKTDCYGASSAKRTALRCSAFLRKQRNLPRLCLLHRGAEEHNKVSKKPTHLAPFCKNQIWGICPLSLMGVKPLPLWPTSALTRQSLASCLWLRIHIHSLCEKAVCLHSRPRPQSGVFAFAKRCRAQIYNPLTLEDSCKKYLNCG
jgi:hypothetical protein